MYRILDILNSRYFTKWDYSETSIEWNGQYYEKVPIANLIINEFETKEEALNYLYDVINEWNSGLIHLCIEQFEIVEC